MLLSGLNSNHGASTAPMMAEQVISIESSVPAAMPPLPDQSANKVSVKRVYTSVEAEVREYYKDTPILAEVSKCESQYRHYDTTGKILRGQVNSADVGAMQINEYYHLKTAVSLGIDIYTLEGNMAYAKYLYEKQGLKPWYSSSPCWGKHSTTLAAK